MTNETYVIDGRDASEFSDAELEALNQALGRRSDEIRLQRMLINRILRIRRERVRVATSLKEAGFEPAQIDAALDRIQGAEAVAVKHAVAPGAVFETTAKRAE